MQIQISNANGDMLELLVALAEGAQDPHARYAGMTTSWAIGGPMIERNRIDLLPDEDGEGWSAAIGPWHATGQTPLVAAARVRCAQFFNASTVDIESVVPAPAP